MIYKLIVLILAILCYAICKKSPSGNNRDDYRSLRNDFDKGNDDFTANFLHDVIHEKPNVSVITSPFSVLFLLSQLALYARGKSYQELENVLNIRNRKDIRTVIPRYLDELNSQRNVNFSLAERVYGSIDYPFSKAFKRDTKNIFHAQATNLNFKNADNAAKEINAWVESQTNNLIKDLISPSALDENTRLVLTDAIYFKGDWKKPFNLKKTRSDIFHISFNKKATVDMMEQLGYYEYGHVEELNSKAIQLFYKNEDFSFLLILPEIEESVYKISEAMTNIDLQNDVVKKLHSTHVNLLMPVIHTETTTDLADILKQNGVTAIFDSSSNDLSGVLKKHHEKLHVSSVIQKARIIVNEAGSEAAAANAITFGATAAVDEPEQFHANRPFLYYIIYKDTPIFAGLYSGP